VFAIPAIIIGLTMCITLEDPRETRVESSPSSSFLADSRQAIGNGNLRWILLSAAVAAGGSGHGIVSTFLPLYLSHNLGMSAPAVGFFFTLLMVGSIAGPMLGGRLADRFSPQRLILSGYVLAALAAAVFPWIAGSSMLLGLFSFVLGIAAFGVNPILQTLVAHVTEDRTRDMGFALFYTATFMAGALWSPAIGFLSDTYGLETSFGAMAVSFIAASGCIALGRFNEIVVSEADRRESLSHG
jgi:predicted MFS family arabinose efflux permease